MTLDQAAAKFGKSTSEIWETLIADEIFMSTVGITVCSTLWLSLVVLTLMSYVETRKSMTADGVMCTDAEWSFRYSIHFGGLCACSFVYGLFMIFFIKSLLNPAMGALKWLSMH